MDVARSRCAYSGIEQKTYFLFMRGARRGTYPKAFTRVDHAVIDGEAVLMRRDNTFELRGPTLATGAILVAYDVVELGTDKTCAPSPWKSAGAAGEAAIVKEPGEAA